MRSLPSRRGPVTEVLLNRLEDEPGRPPSVAAAAAGDPLPPMHVTADALHEAIAAVDPAGGRTREDEPLARDIVWGARALSHLDARWASHALRCGSEHRTSLLPAPRAFERDAVGNSVLTSG